MKGFSLIEIIVVVALVAILSLFASIKFNQFRQEAVINLAAEEFASTVKSARSRSMTGQIIEGKSASDFAKDGLPSYGVEVAGSAYKLFRDYKWSDGSENTEYQEVTQLDSTFNITGSPKVKFERISGKSAGASFVIGKTGASEKRQIDVDSDGVITITKI